MKQPESIKDKSARLRRVGEILTRLADNPDAFSKMSNALQAADTIRFHEVLKAIGFPGPLPPDECIEIVKAITVFVSEGWQGREVCSWQGERLAKDKVREAGELIASAADSQRMFEILKRLGVIKCHIELVPVRKAIPKEIDVKICPGFKVTPGPDPTP